MTDNRPSPQACAFRKAIAEAERLLLPFVSNQSFGDICLRFQFDRGRVTFVTKEESLKIKIES